LGKVTDFQICPHFNLTGQRFEQVAAAGWRELLAGYAAGA